jgi:hypothetical protein
MLNREKQAVFVVAVIAICGSERLADSTHAESSEEASPKATVQPTDVKLAPLFPMDGVVSKGWRVTDWEDVSKPPAKPLAWEVNDGVLYGTGGLRDDVWVGTWLLSEQEYENFILDFDFHLGKDWGNGGVALRAPMRGDPASDGMELQLTEPHYQMTLVPGSKPVQLTGAIYLAIAPKKQVYKPNSWNHLRIELHGPLLHAWLNKELILDANLDKESDKVTWHDGEKKEKLLPLSQRPRRGHIGFQDLSGEGGKLRVKNAMFAELK